MRSLNSFRTDSVALTFSELHCEAHDFPWKLLYTFATESMVVQFTKAYPSAQAGWWKSTGRYTKSKPPAISPESMSMEHC